MPDSTVIFENPTSTPVMQGGFPVQSANYSDGLSSGGTYYYSQSLAQQFVISAGSTAAITGMSFWGASQYAGVVDPWAQTALAENITGFDIAILRVTVDGNFTSVRSWSLNRNQVLQTLTGNYREGTLSPIFELSTVLDGDVSLGAGAYALSIGARLSNPDGNAFAWADGQWAGSDPSTRLYATVGDVPSEWGIFVPVQTETSGSFRLTGTVVPAPGALALLGLVAFRSRRRS